MKQFLQSIWTRIAALGDKSAWLLIVPAALVLYFLVDGAMLKTLAQWSAYGLVLAGVSVVVSRIVFPQIKLTDLVESALNHDNRAAATIAAALVLFVGLLMLSLVIWAKA